MDQKQLEALFEQAETPDSSPGNIPQPGVPVQAIEVWGADPEDKEGHVKMTDQEIDGILGMHISNSANWYGSEIAREQAKAMEYYLGLAVGDLAPPGVQGRSTIVDTTVSDQIEWMMPALMEMFFASGNIVNYDPRKPGDEAGAKQMSNLVNYIVTAQNPGFQVFMDWFKNALLNKVGVAKVFWEPQVEETREYYDQMTDAELAIIMDDSEVEVIKVTSYVDPRAELAAMDQFRQQQAAVAAYQQAAAQAQAQGLPFPPPPPAGPPGSPPPPPPQPPQPPQPIDISKLPQLHDVVARASKKSGKVAIEAMNPEDFLIQKNSRRVGDGFCAHRVKRTVSYLRSQGYANVDDIGNEITSDADAESAENSEVQLAREALQNVYTPPNASEDFGDESMREVWLYECYLPIDCDGDGIAEWRKITRAGNAILENVMVEGPPFATLCPVPIPGLFFGRSIADLGIPTQFSKTGVLRSIVDNMNVQVNGRTWAIENQVNINDLLTNRPGGVVRVKSANAVGILQQGMADSQGAYQLLEYLDTMGQERSGITKYSQGLDSDSLNHTATGIENITSRADLRVKLIARCFGETGIKELCKLIQRELKEHQDANIAFQVDGNWVDVDPRVWHNQYIIKANVGLGTGDRTRKVQQILQLMGVQQQALAIGLVTPTNLYNTASDLVDAMQLSQPSRYFTPVDPNAPKPPPPPDPQMVLVQGQLQIEKQKADDKRATDQFEAQLKAQESDRDHQYRIQELTIKEQMLDARARDQQTAQLSWEREKFYADLAQKETAAALKAQADGATAVATNNAIVTDMNTQQQVQIPIEAALTARQQDLDSAHQDADRQHAAQQAHADRQHQAQQAELDRQQQAEQAEQAQATQAAAAQQPGTTES
jgi:hypothetical protein